MNQNRASFRWPVVVALCLAILLPGIGQVASAQPLCLGDTFWDAEAEACVNADGTPATNEIPAEEPAEEPVAEPTMEPTVDPGALEGDAPSEVMTIQTYFFFCDASQDWFAYARANHGKMDLCPEGKVIDYPVNGYLALDGSHWGTITPAWTGSRGFHVAWLPEVPRGRWTMTTDTPGGYGIETIPICMMRTSALVSEESDVYYPLVDPATGAFDLPDNNDYEVTTCYVHFVPTATGATVDIVVYACPAEIENFHFRSNDSRRLACNDPIPAMDFALQEFRGIHRTTSIEPPENVASFAAVLNGFVDIISSVPEGYSQPVVYCETRQPDGAKLKLYSYVAPINSGAIRYEILTPTGKMYCDWFLLPIEVEGSDPLALAGDATPDASTEADLRDPAAEPTLLTVQRWECPPAISTDEYGALLEGCTKASDAGDLGISSDTGNVLIEIDGGVLSSPLQFSGTMTISGSQPVAVYCSRVASLNGEVTEQFPESVPVTDGTLSLDIAEGTTAVYCDWFATD